MNITVFSKPDCMQCHATCRILDNEGVEYTVVDITQDAEAHQQVMDLGYRGLPVVKASDDLHWSGFRPERIKELTQH